MVLVVLCMPKALAANKAYLEYSGADAREYYLFDETTATTIINRIHAHTRENPIHLFACYIDLRTPKFVRDSSLMIRLALRPSK